MIISDEIASGRRLLSQGQASAAQHVAERVLTTEPTSEAAWILLIDSWSARGSLSQALKRRSADCARRRTQTASKPG